MACPTITPFSVPAIICAAQARGLAPRGGVPVELALSGPAFAAELMKRGFDLRVTWRE